MKLLSKTMFVAASFVAATFPAFGDMTNWDNCFRSKGEDAVRTCTSTILTSGGLEKTDRANLFNQRGVAYLSLDRYDLAIRDFDVSIELNRSLAAPFVNRGIAYKESGQYERAIEDYDKAIELKPNLAAAFNNRASAYSHLGQYERALRDYDKAIELKPNFASGFNGRCWARAVWGQQLDAALADCNKSLTLRPADPATLNSRGFVHLRMGNYMAAIEDYTASLAKDATAASSLYCRGVARLKSGDAGGNADIEAAKKLDSKIADTYSRYGLTS